MLGLVISSKCVYPLHFQGIWLEMTNWTSNAQGNAFWEGQCQFKGLKMNKEMEGLFKNGVLQEFSAH